MVLLEEYLSLHSTMFLLIRHDRHTALYKQVFTFHNVSINTGYKRKVMAEYYHPLHSTMFLLIQGIFPNPALGRILYIPQCFY